MRILIASPVRDRAWIVPTFIDCLSKTELPEGAEADYLFIDDASEDDSLEMLERSVHKLEGEVTIESLIDCGVPADDRNNRKYLGIYHHLREIREMIRDYALFHEYDYLYCIDSDILVRPDTLKALIAGGREFVAATLANTYDGRFTGVNAVAIKPGGLGPWDDPPKWRKFEYKPDGLQEVAVSGACFLVTKEALRSASYLWEPLPHSPQEYLLLRTEGEDAYLGLSMLAAGIRQYLLTDHRVYHCMTEARLTAFDAARPKYGAKTVRVLADRDWLLDCPYCKKRKEAIKGETGI